MKKFIVVCDIDGTLADCSHRRPHLDEKPKNWKAFNSKMHLDEPIKPLVEFINLMGSKIGVKILIVSGREDCFKKTTEEWLSKHNLIYDNLFMRKTGDYRDDQIIKQEILDEIIEQYSKPDIVFDDRDRVVDMWRANGILCCQVAPGDF